MKYKMAILSILLVSIFFGCSLKSEKEKCEAIKGNVWIPQGKAQILTCVKTFSDVGKACTSSNECQGECIVTEAGKPAVCAKDDSKFGCRSSIEDFKKYGGILCAD